MKERVLELIMVEQADPKLASKRAQDDWPNGPM